MSRANHPVPSDVRSYLSGIGHLEDRPLVADLSLNENALGPSPSALRAFRDAADALCRYPDGTQHALRLAISQHYGVDQNRIVCGAGADELITLLTRLFVKAGDEVVFPEYSFVMFSLNTLRVGAISILAPTIDFTASVDNIIERITSKTRLVFLANPNNPTGTYLLRNDLRRLAAALPPGVPLAIDSVYADYVGDPEYSDGTDLLDDFKNIVVLRSFSKMCALASLRIGWCFAAPETADRLDRIRNPYNVSGPAQAAAIAATKDTEHNHKSYLHNSEWRDCISAGLRQFGIQCATSGGNFVMAAFPNPGAADGVYSMLLENGIRVRRLVDYALPSCLRITVGTQAHNRLLLSTLGGRVNDADR